MSQRATIQTSKPLRETLRVYKPPDTEPDTEPDSSFRILSANLEVIAILTDVTELCFRPPHMQSLESCGNIPHILLWDDVATELREWHRNQPPEFQELSQS